MDQQDDALVDQAIKKTASALPYNYDLPEISSVQEECLSSRNNPEEFFFENYLDALNDLKKHFPDYVFSGSCVYTRRSKSLSRDGGVSHGLNVDLFDWHFLFKDKKSANMIDGWYGGSTVQDFQVKAEINHFKKMLGAYDTIVDIQEKKLPVIFLQQDQIIQKLGESFRIDNYQQGIGIFRHQLEKRIINQKISLTDSIFNPDKCAIRLFDGDGLTRHTPDLNLIENGFFTNIASDLRNAEIYGTEFTGNGVRDYKSSVQLGFHDLLLKDGTQTPQELLRGIDKCIVVGMAAGGEFTNEGDYATPVQLSFLMEKGEYVGRLPQLTVKSNLKQMLGSDLLGLTKGSFSSLDNNPALIMEMEVLKN